MWISTSQRPSFLISAALRHLRAFLGVFLVAASVSPSVLLSLRLLVNVSPITARVFARVSRSLSLTLICAVRGTLAYVSARSAGSSAALTPPCRHHNIKAIVLLHFFFFFFSGAACAQGSGAPTTKKDRAPEIETHTHTHTQTHRCKCKFCVYTVTARINIVQLRSTLREWGLQREPKYRKWLRPNDLVWNSRHGGGG